MYKYDHQKNSVCGPSRQGEHLCHTSTCSVGGHHHALRLGPEMYSLGLSFFVTMQQLWCAAGYYCTVRLLARLNQVYKYGYQKVEVAVSYSPRGTLGNLYTQFVWSADGHMLESSKGIPLQTCNLRSRGIFQASCTAGLPGDSLRDMRRQNGKFPT